MTSRKLHIMLAAMACLSTLNPQLSASPLGTAFTYQGKLTDGGAPANGSYDLVFTLFDAASGPTAVAGPLTNSAVGVINGLFTVTVDFGLSAFSGDARWLEIAARTNGAGPFATFTARQPLTGAPYALYAANAGFATTASSANVATSAHTVASNSIVSASIVPGQVVKSLNGLNDAVTLVAGANVTLGTNGNTLTFAAAGGGTTGGWSTTGNADTSAATNFLGTTDNQPLELRVNAQRAMRLEPNINGAPNVIGGFGGNQVSAGVYAATIAGGGSPAAPHQVAGSGGTVGGGAENRALGMVATVSGGQANVAGGSAATVGGGAGNTIQTNADFGTIPGGTLNRVAAPYGLAAGRRAKANHPGAFVWADSTDADLASTSSNQFLIRASGGVGIGTTDPAGAALRVAGPIIADNFLGQGNTLIMGTTDTQPLELRVNGTRALRLEPTGSDVLRVGMFNMVGGSPVNYLAPGVYGSVIAGGGAVFFRGNNNVSNSVWSDLSFLGGGSHNCIEPDATFSVLGGGDANRIQTGAYNSFVGGGVLNLITTNAGYSFIGGGSLNTIERNAQESFIGGGQGNYIRPNAGYSFLGGGASNTNSGAFGVVVGGSYNSILLGASYSTIGGGAQNVVSTKGTYGPNETATYSTIAGGWQNIAGGPWATVGGGWGNEASNRFATVGGGNINRSTGQGATVAGGFGNIASGTAAFVGGGGTDEGGFVGANWAAGTASSIGGGFGNSAGNFAFIGGGRSNTASGSFAAIPGGSNNLAAGFCGFAAGRRAKAYGNGTFVWADSVDHDLAVIPDNQFVVRASGGCNFWTAVDASGVPTVGVFMMTGDTDWRAWCDRNLKQNFKPVDDRAVLEKVAQLPVTEWNLVSQDPSFRHIGPVAQEFHAAFGLGGPDDKSINNTDAHGVLFAAVKGLNQKMEAENAALKQEIAELKRLVNQLNAKLNGGAQ